MVPSSIAGVRRARSRTTPGTIWKSVPPSGQLPPELEACAGAQTDGDARVRHQHAEQRRTARCAGTSRSDGATATAGCRTRQACRRDRRWRRRSGRRPIPRGRPSSQSASRPRRLRLGSPSTCAAGARSSSNPARKRTPARPAPCRRARPRRWRRPASAARCRRRILWLPPDIPARTARRQERRRDDATARIARNARPDAAMPDSARIVSPCRRLRVTRPSRRRHSRPIQGNCCRGR